MKRFIIISLAAILAMPVAACCWSDSHNNYLFSPFAMEEFSQRFQDVTIQNWKTYLGITEEYWWFQADEVVKAARKKNDALMVSYVQNLDQYLQCVEERSRDRWEYPTKVQLAARKQRLLAVRTYAQGKLKTRLRSQHALLFMRCNMMLGRHTENVRFWEQTASNYIETVYKDMMKNIYAGALLKTGRDAEAGSIYAEQGDWASLMTQYYKRRSYEAIRQEYLRDANSAVLPFLLKDFVNNAQEAVDSHVEGFDLPGKLFIRDISKAEARQMMQLAGQVVREGKSKTPVLWQSAKAWLEYLFDNRRQATADIQRAMAMEGTERMKDNARVLKFYITAAQTPAGDTFDGYVAAELKWMDGKIKDNGDDFFRGALDRLVHQVLTEKYAAQPVTTLALTNATDNSLFSEHVDTIGVDHLISYLHFLDSDARTPLMQYLKTRQQCDPHQLNDLVGTKYLRLCQWDKALAWLQKVPLSYYNERGYAYYAANRRWTVEPWLTRQWLRYSDDPQHLKSNPKADFAREMQTMESEMNVLAGLAQQQRCYDLAVRYAQACFTGDCWFLMRDGKSCSDTVRTNEADLAEKALSLLRKASQSSNFTLREKALFAMCYGGLYPVSKRWSVEEWDSKAIDYVKRYNRQTPQFKAFAALDALEKENAGRTARYVSHCDEYRQFRQHHR